jgi:hypothetical protein
VHLGRCHQHGLQWQTSRGGHGSTLNFWRSVGVPQTFARLASAVALGHVAAVLPYDGRQQRLTARDGWRVAEAEPTLSGRGGLLLIE